jgi:hypothetical protein
MAGSCGPTTTGPKHLPRQEAEAKARGERKVLRANRLGHDFGRRIDASRVDFPQPMALPNFIVRQECDVHRSSLLWTRCRRSQFPNRVGFSLKAP